MRIDDILDLIREEPDPDPAWRRVLEICNADRPSALWSSLPAVDIAADATRLCAWLEAALQGVDGPLGLYLGLDTLNMDGGAGTNLEIGWSRRCDTTSDGVDWVFGELERGSKTLIRGLVPLHAEYAQDRWRDRFSVADYMLFLAYSGLVLACAVRQLARTDPMLVAWGFHDGDIFALCRCGRGRFEMICS